MKKCILERRDTEETQAASSGGRDASSEVSDYSWREGGDVRGVSGGGTGS